MKKSELRNKMIVCSSDGRYGVVCLDDATDENCIKFFYNPMAVENHGYTGINIVPLEQFTEDLKYICPCEEARRFGIITDHAITMWSISAVYSVNKEWTQRTCISTCRHISMRKDIGDSEPIAYCKAKDNLFIGFINDIHCNICPCIADDEAFFGHGHNTTEYSYQTYNTIDLTHTRKL